MRKTYEQDDAAFPADAYTVGKPDVAWRVLGWELAPIMAWSCCDCDASGYERPEGGGWMTSRGDAECDHATVAWDEDEERTGRIVAVMVGDNQHWVFDPEDVTPLDREDYCGSCGQVGCAHDGYDR